VRLGLNLMFLADGAGGAGRYAFELTPALLAADEVSHVTAFVTKDAPRELLAEPWSGEVEWVELPGRISHRTHLVAQAAALPVLAARRRLDVLHSLANGGPPATPRVAHVVTMLDLIWLRQRLDWGSRSAVWSMELFTRVAARTADRLLTISNAAREDLVEMFGVDPAFIDVSPLGVRVREDVAPASEEELRAKLELGTSAVVLCVAQKRPYKNLGVLIRALAMLSEDGPALVLPGATSAYEDELRTLASDLEVADRVRFVEWVSERELEGLYRLAACFVLPSLIEGFGLPVLEAMARGVPVACSRRPALTEVAGDAALLFDPLDATAVADSIRRLMHDGDLRAGLVERGRERAGLFSWSRTAEATIGCYERALVASGK